MPSAVQEFLENIYVTEDDGSIITNSPQGEILGRKDTKSFFLVARNDLG